MWAWITPLNTEVLGEHRGERRGEKREGWASSHCKRHVTFQTLGAQRYIVPSMRTSNQHTPKQTGQQGFSLVETLLCEKIKPACKLKICLRATFWLICTSRMWRVGGGRVDREYILAIVQFLGLLESRKEVVMWWCNNISKRIEYAIQFHCWCYYIKERNMLLLYSWFMLMYNTYRNRPY